MHPDHEELTLLALGEERPDAGRHVDSCAACRAELDELTALVDDVREVGEVELAPLPEGLWHRVAQEAGIDAAAGTAVLTSASSEQTLDHEPGQGTAGPVATAPHGGGTPRRREAPHRPGAGARSHRPRGHRGRTARWSTAALAGAAAIGAAAVFVATTLWPSGDEGEPVAAAELVPLASSVEGGSASVEVITRDDAQVLVIDADALPDEGDGYLEVWLTDAEVSGLMTVGTLSQDRQEFVLPAGLDLGSSPVVDVSLEHFDGDPGHSGDSLWRGDLGL